MGNLARWGLIGAIFLVVAVVPAVVYRYAYTHSKRLREVDPGRVYRSGQMTAPGFAEAVAQFGIRTIVNLQDDYPDPGLDEGYFTLREVKESELCRRLGVRYVHLAPDLVSKKELAPRPKVIDQFLTLMDDPENYPVLIHCRAGLHRTGMLVAVYRMEYQGWDRGRAIREVKANGFGETGCTTANDYVAQYVLNYRPGLPRRTVTGPIPLVPRNQFLPASTEPLHELRP